MEENNKLKNVTQNKITYRKLERKDGAQLLRLMDMLDHETEFMLFEAGERNTDKEAEKAYEDRIETMNRNGSVTIGAFSEDELIGFVTADRGSLNRIRHKAYIVTGIRENFRGMGTGTCLFRELDRWASANEIVRLELTVHTSNEAGIRLYKSSGFKIEGTKEKSIFMNDRYYDEYYMAKILK